MRIADCGLNGKRQRSAEGGRSPRRLACGQATAGLPCQGGERGRLFRLTVRAKGAKLGRFRGEKVCAEQAPLGRALRRRDGKRGSE